MMADEQTIKDGDVEWTLADIKELDSQLSAAEDRIAELEEELEAPCQECAAADAEIEELEGQAFNSQDFAYQLRVMLARGETNEAIDYCDRFLPARLRYAS